MCYRNDLKYSTLGPLEWPASRQIDLISTGDDGLRWTVRSIKTSVSDSGDGVGRRQQQQQLEARPVAGYRIAALTRCCQHSLSSVRFSSFRPCRRYVTDPTSARAAAGCAGRVNFTLSASVNELPNEPPSVSAAAPTAAGGAINTLQSAVLHADISPLFIMSGARPTTVQIGLTIQ